MLNWIHLWTSANFWLLLSWMIACRWPVKKYLNLLAQMFHVLAAEEGWNLKFLLQAVTTFLCAFFLSEQCGTSVSRASRIRTRSTLSGFFDWKRKTRTGTESDCIVYHVIYPPEVLWVSLAIYFLKRVSYQIYFNSLSGVDWVLWWNPSPPNPAKPGAAPFIPWMRTGNLASYFHLFLNCYV